MRRRYVYGIAIGVGLALGCDPDSSRDENDDREGHECYVLSADRTCGAEGEGIQYCFEDEDGDRRWGTCWDLAEAPCVLGEETPCDPETSEMRVCTLEAGDPVWGLCLSEMVDTPLVLVLPGTTMAFEPAGTSTFDLGGECITHDWPGSSTPWLALDRDLNGSIDDGEELFGTATILRSGARASQGFQALADLDVDGDGFITPADPAFSDLVLWFDDDGDRRSTHAEHESLASRGIMALPVDFEVARECDDRGNCAVERSSVVTASGVAALVDVHLPCQ